MKCSWCETEIARDDEEAFVLVIEDEDGQHDEGRLFCSTDCMIASL